MTAALVSVALGLLTASGVYLMLRARTFELVLGLTLLSYAVNLFIFFMGRLAVGMAPIVDKVRAPTLANYADPLPQALVLTAIVISFAMTAVLLVIALRARAETGTDHVDGVELSKAPADSPDARPGQIATVSKGDA
jgi:multicomponent K+:H+ antiporter subunit C